MGRGGTGAKGGYSAFKSPKDLSLPKSPNPISPYKISFGCLGIYAGLADAVVPVNRGKPGNHCNPSAHRRTAELSISSNLSEGSGVSLALEPHIDLGFNPSNLPGASSRPLPKWFLPFIPFTSLKSLNVLHHNPSP